MISRIRSASDPWASLFCGSFKRNIGQTGSSHDSVINSLETITIAEFPHNSRLAIRGSRQVGSRDRDHSAKLRYVDVFGRQNIPLFIDHDLFGTRQLDPCNRPAITELDSIFPGAYETLTTLDPGIFLNDIASRSGGT